eukprot:760685_1
MSLKQPVGFVRLTNVAVVRLHKGGKRFEVACYRNKIMDWRNGIEKDIDEVLQTDKVFLNVSKGKLADSTSMLKAFETDDESVICKIILSKGVAQISEKERQLEITNLSKVIANTVGSKCVNTDTKRPFPVAMIEQATKDFQFKIDAKRPAKPQALALLQQLEASEDYPVMRAQMRLHISMAQKAAKDVKRKIHHLVASFEDESWDDFYDAVILINPGDYSELVSCFQSNTHGHGTLAVEHSWTWDTRGSFLLPVEHSWTWNTHGHGTLMDMEHSWTRF